MKFMSRMKSFIGGGVGGPPRLCKSWSAFWIAAVAALAPPAIKLRAASLIRARSSSLRFM
jgi:hypothetical protein